MLPKRCYGSFHKTVSTLFITAFKHQHGTPQIEECTSVAQSYESTMCAVNKAPSKQV